MGFPKSLCSCRRQKRKISRERQKQTTHPNKIQRFSRQTRQFKTKYEEGKQARGKHHSGLEKEIHKTATRGKQGHVSVLTTLRVFLSYLLIAINVSNTSTTTS